VENEASDARIEVTVLGCSGTFPGPRGACTGYLVRSAGRTVLLDCGPGTLANLQLHASLRDLDAVVITHSHPDHWVELPVLRNVWKWVLRCEDHLPVITTAETWAMAEVAAGGDMSDTFQRAIVRDGSDVRIGPQRWRFSRTDHPVETLAVRVDSDQRSFAFSSDTGRGWSLEALSFGDGIDLAFVESTFVDSTYPGGVQHLTARLAGATAAAAGVRHLVLTHLLPGEDPAAHLSEARASFDGSPAATQLSVAEIHERYHA
jgi:ribonuclease BN (tRNA processing enzyme)